MKKNIFFLEYLSVKFYEQKILLLSLYVLQNIKKKNILMEHSKGKKEENCSYTFLHEKYTILLFFKSKIFLRLAHVFQGPTEKSPF